MQRAFRFDKATCKKILKSLYLAILPALAVACIAFLNAVTVEEGIYATVWAYVLPIIVNGIVEFVKGKTGKDINTRINEK